MKNQILLACLILIGAGASATTFKGYDRKPSAAEMTMTDSIARFIETDKEFLILFSHHPAFYLLPKNVGYANQVRSFLQTSIHANSVVSAQLNPVTTEISYIGSSQ